jgi:hypothetical protein
MEKEDRGNYQEDRFAHESVWANNQQSNKTKEVEPSKTINKLL